MIDLTKRWRIKNGAYAGREFFPSTAYTTVNETLRVFGYVESNRKYGEKFITCPIADGRLEEIKGEV